MLDRRRTIIQLRIRNRGLTKTSQDKAARRPCLPVPHPSHIDCATEERRVGPNGLHGQEASITKPPDTDAIGVHVAQSLEVVCAGIYILGFASAEVSGCSGG